MQLDSQPCPDCPKGWDNEPDGLSIYLFPNPASDEVVVGLSAALPETGEIAVYDARGRKVHAQVAEEGVQTWTLRLADLNVQSGLYLVVLKSGGKVLTERLMVAR